MKKVGIITMHKVLNYGSALQAYALQEVIKSLEYEVELIDYIFPNDYHKSIRPKHSLLIKIVLFIIQLLCGFPEFKRRRIFSKFYEDFFSLSAKQYVSKEDIKTNPPVYDIYVTGSDQVWNSKYIGEDTTFMLSFIGSKAKISYSSSFVSDSIPDEYRELYKSCLSQYKSFAVREQNGSEILWNLLGRDSKVVLDPTLLLSVSHYEHLVAQSKIVFNEPYILAYILGYSFNPYPYVEEVINHLQSKLKQKVYLLCVSNTKMLFKSNSKRLQIVGPCEFVSLFKNASYVVTTSFHGTAFAINYLKPFYALVESNGDDRIVSLLDIMGLSSRALFNNSTLPEVVDFYYTEENIRKFESLRNSSLEYLKTALSNL